MRGEQQDMRSTRLENGFFKRGEMAMARQPAVPGGFQSLRFGGIARIGAVINIEAGQFVEADEAVESVRRQGGGELPEPGAVASDVAEAAPTGEFDGNIFWAFALPGAGEEGDGVAARGAEAGDFQAIALQPAVGKIIKQQKAQFHWRGRR